MKIYLGSSSALQFIIAGVTCLVTPPPSSNYIMSADNYLLQDVDGLYLITKEVG